jgi:hypothetical protein
MRSVTSLSSLLGKFHIALAPMNGAGYFFVWFDATDVNSISNGANTKMDTSICIDFQYLLRTLLAWARMDESGRRSQADSKARSQYAQRPSSNPDDER